MSKGYTESIDLIRKYQCLLLNVVRGVFNGSYQDVCYEPEERPKSEDITVASQT